jgi:hypothetical protein
MTESSIPERREFLGKVAAGAIALGLSGGFTKALAEERFVSRDTVPSDQWLESIKGKHRQFFDMPNHENGMGLLHVRNYLNTLRDTYGMTFPKATAVVGLYGGTTMLGFNDAMWKKYGLGNPTKAMNGSNAPADANIFYTTAAGASALSVTGAPIPIPADSSIVSLQQRGAVFILCNNAFNVWMGLLGGGDAAKTTALRGEFAANMLPGVHLVPAMVVAINQAQMHGCTYMYL